MSRRATGSVGGEFSGGLVMVKLVALWTAPNNRDAFEADYLGTHVPLVAPLPGLRGASAWRALDGPYHRMAELSFDDAESLRSALGSEAGKQLLADADRLQREFATRLDVLTVEQNPAG